MFAIDTHLHTCLSPCAELDMHPAMVVESAVRAGLDAVCVCDHNSAENVSAVVRAGRAAGMVVIPGMEITSEEEVHILGLMPDVEAALTLQSRVYHALPGKNDEGVFGMQVVANEEAEVLGFNDRLLAGATTLSVERVVELIHRAGGLAVASHVDREGFGIIGQLGMIPPGLTLDALEISRRTPLQEARRRYAPRDEWALLCSSDAHEPSDVGRGATYALLEAPTVAELGLAIRGLEGRSVLGGGRPMEDLALHIMDIARNGIEAGARRIEIDLEEDRDADRFVIMVADDGRGMDPETAARSTDPFFSTRTSRRIGMGLPLLAEAARAAGGGIEVKSEPGRGTRVRAEFQHRHIDRAPLGDIETTLLTLFVGHPGVALRFRHKIGPESYELESADFAEAGIDPSSAEGIATLRRVIREGEQRICR